MILEQTSLQTHVPNTYYFIPIKKFSYEMPDDSGTKEPNPKNGGTEIVNV